ncbi:MAG: flagellar hook capping protein [Lachnospiraceae bacterium]|jgi:flagellar basal-body rod modification protein FlgD|nr:flagellar hook capping protein [Lachnospiraceae bacterium]
MAITAIVDQGKIVNNGVKDSEKQEIKKSTNGGVDQDMFLQLLVAEMKFQDPLEPTSNTEWISQYATFTQIEQGTAMQTSMQQMEASQLVGKQVIMKSTNNITGETNYFSGMVDYMYVENGKTFLSVNNELYNIEDLDTVVDPTYMDAVQKAKDFEGLLDKMPPVKSLDYNKDLNLVVSLRKFYDDLSEYEKGFIKEDLVNIMKAYETRLKEIEPEPDTDSSTEDGANDEQGNGNTEQTGSTENGSSDTP